jgi:hypothetical protein
MNHGREAMTRIAAASKGGVAQAASTHEARASALTNPTPLSLQTGSGDAFCKGITMMVLERVPGIEPGYSAWKAAALPLSYTRAARLINHLPSAGKAIVFKITAKSFTGKT